MRDSIDTARVVTCGGRVVSDIAVCDRLQAVVGFLVVRVFIAFLIVFGFFFVFAVSSQFSDVFATFVVFFAIVSLYRKWCYARGCVCHSRPVSLGSQQSSHD